jgi:NAD(P)-dependent dehydrogenase (short-subunit alcohol dehydrogenase family)
MSIEGKVALVTGGASGLGRATSEALAGAGASVLIVDLPGSPAEVVAKELGDRAHYATADVTSEAEVSSALEAAVSAFGGLHIAVNCAGVAWVGRVLSREGEPHSLEQFETVVRVNLVGTFNVTRLAAAQMVRQEPDGEERGVIINTASVAAFEGQIGQSAYSASKGGVASMTLPLARDLAASKIRVVSIAPGIFDTPMMAMLPSETRDQLVANAPHPRRLGRPEEFAALVRHIVENSMLNGEVIRLDGGLRMPPK